MSRPEKKVLLRVVLSISQRTINEASIHYKAVDFLCNLCIILFDCAAGEKSARKKQEYPLFGGIKEKNK